MTRSIVACLVVTLAAAASAASQTVEQDVAYPFPISYLDLTVYGQPARMAYMDVPASVSPNGRTVVLLHGMNFAGFYWRGPIDVLRREGFRVVVRGPC